jgi:hypothetical protein
MKMKKSLIWTAVTVGVIGIGVPAFAAVQTSKPLPSINTVKTTVEDVRGNCDEAEHASDPRCATMVVPAAPASGPSVRVDDSTSNSIDDNGVDATVTTVDDHGTDATENSIDDHGNDATVNSIDDNGTDATVNSIDDNGVDATVNSIDDNGVDATVTTVDDHGNDATVTTVDDSGHHNGGADDSGHGGRNG